MKLDNEPNFTSNCFIIVLFVFFMNSCNEPQNKSLETYNGHQENYSTQRSNTQLIFDFEVLDFQYRNEFPPHSVQIVTESNEKESFDLSIDKSVYRFGWKFSYQSKEGERYIYDYEGDSLRQLLDHIAQDCDLEEQYVTCTSLSIRDCAIDSVLIYTSDKRIKLPFLSQE